MKFTDEKGHKWKAVKLGSFYHFEGWSKENHCHKFMWDGVPANFVEGWPQ